MKWDQHSYFKKTNRIPKPSVKINEKENLFLLGIPWGNSDYNEQGFQKLEDYFVAAKEDNEATSPFPKIPQYPVSLNNLQVATQIFGQSLLREVNKDEYVSGVEFLGLYKEGEELGWVSCGGPSIIISKANGDLKLIHTEGNWAETKSAPSSNLARNFLGIYPQVHLSMGFTQIDPLDKVLLIYTSQLSPLGLKDLNKQLNLKSFVEKNFDSNSKQAFWVGELSF